MPVNATVLYPSTADAKFDMKYYLATHMPLVMEKWGPLGLQKWDVVQFTKGPDGGEPQFSVQAILTWGKVEEITAAVASESAKEVFGDVPNFSNKSPVFLMGEVVGSS